MFFMCIYVGESTRCVSGCLVLLDADIKHTFSAETPRWGFTVHLSWWQLKDPAHGLLVNDTLKVCHPPLTLFVHTWCFG
jgi:hypothetical protein